MENQHSVSPEVTFHVDHSDSKAVVKKIIRTTILLSIITIIELALGYVIVYLHKQPEPSDGLVLAIKGVIVILSLAKAFYIVGIFMHLGDEIRNMIMTIVVPLLLFVWFIIAFLADGNSYKTLRNRYDPHHKETKAPAHGEGEKPGAVH